MSTLSNVTNQSSRYVNTSLHPRENYDYITYEDDVDDDGDYADEDYDAPPTDEDKFERLNRRRRDVHQRMLEKERLPKATTTRANKKYASGEYDDDYESTPPPPASASTRSTGHAEFSFDGGFESDFNQSSPPPAPAGTASSCNSTPAASVTTPSTKSTFRFSNDFSVRDKMLLANESQPKSNSCSPAIMLAEVGGSTTKLRFDERVRVSKIDDAAFEDDFGGVNFDFDKADAQWPSPTTATTPTTPLTATTTMTTTTAAATTTASKCQKQYIRSNKLQQRNELIRKSESVNIFAKRAEDPFEDDEFFKSPNKQTLSEQQNNNNHNNKNHKQNGINHHNNNNQDHGNGNFQWIEDDVDEEEEQEEEEERVVASEANFAKFDENM